MNEILKSKLGIMANDDLLISAIRTAFNEVLEKSSPKISEMDDDNLIGQKTRANEKAKEIINNFFATLEEYNLNKPQNSKLSKER